MYLNAKKSNLNYTNFQTLICIIEFTEPNLILKYAYMHSLNILTVLNNRGKFKYSISNSSIILKLCYIEISECDL